MPDSNTRKATNRILELIEEGDLNRDAVILACLKYMSEDEVADMAHCNEFAEVEEVYVSDAPRTASSLAELSDHLPEKHK
jgi:hypothetical protein